jgi:hypothetical protein
MIQITVDEYVNGFSVRGYDTKDGYFLNEIHEERLEALLAVETWIKNEMITELERRVHHAATM